MPDDRPTAEVEIHPVAGVTAQRLAELDGPLGWGDSCRRIAVEEAVSSLRQCELFAGLSDEDLVEIAKLTYECRWAKDSVLFHEREPARNFCVLTQGLVALEKEIRLGPHSAPRQARVEFMQPRDALAWSSLVAPYQYTKTAIAVQPTTALCMDGQSLRDLMARRPSMGVVLFSRVATIIKSRLETQSSLLLYFLSIISHELRAPLAAVENYLQVMLNGYAGPLTPDQQTMLERSVIRLSEMANLIAGVLDLARMHPEQIRQAFEEVDLQEVATQAIEDIELRMRQKRINLVVDACDPWPTLLAAHGRLRQVISNLLSNAVKFAPEGSTVWLVVRTKDSWVQLEVIDQGPGVPREELQHIFEAFYRVSGTAETAGLGLGLSIVKRIVDAHNGRIWAESPYPAGGRGGARFVVELPQTSNPGTAGQEETVPLNMI